MALCLPRPGQRVVPPIDALENPQVARIVRGLSAVPHDVYPLNHVAFDDGKTSVGGDRPCRSHHGIHAWNVGNHLAVDDLAGRRRSDDPFFGLERQRPDHWNAVNDPTAIVSGNGGKILDITRADPVLTTDDLELRRGERLHSIFLLSGHPLKGCRDHRGAGTLSAHVSVPVDRCHVGIGAPPLERDIRPRRSVGMVGGRIMQNCRAFVQGPRLRGYLDPFDVRPVDPDGYLNTRRRPIGVGR